MAGGLLGGFIGYGPYAGGQAGGYGGLLGGGLSPNMGLLSDTLTGLGVGLLSQQASPYPISPLAGVGRGLEYSNQLNQQRRATMQQQLQNQLAQRAADLQGQQFGLQKEQFGIEQQKAQREQQQYDQQQKAIAQFAQEHPDLGAMAQADPGAVFGAIAKQQFLPPTDVQRNYIMDGGDAKWGSLSNYQKFLAQAGANTTTVNMPPQENAFQQKYGMAEGEQAAALPTTAATAQGQINNLDRLQQTVSQLQQSGGNVGALAPLKQKATELSQAFGIDPTKLGLPSDAGPYEQVTAITNQLALQARNTANGQGMPGSMSDADRAFLQSSVPSIKDTPLGLQMKIETARRVAQRQVEAASVWQSGTYPHTQTGWEQFQKDWTAYNQNHPVFDEAFKKAAKNLPNETVPNMPNPNTPPKPMIVPTLPQGFQ